MLSGVLGQKLFYQMNILGRNPIAAMVLAISVMIFIWANGSICRKVDQFVGNWIKMSKTSFQNPLRARVLEMGNVPITRKIF